MPVVQPCQDAKPVCFESFHSFFAPFFERAGVRSLKDLNSLDQDSLLDLLTHLFHYRDFPQNRSCNFTSSLFADASMNNSTLDMRIAELKSIIKKINLLSTNPEADPRVIEYSKELMNLAILDHDFWNHICGNTYDNIIQCLQQLEEKSKEILPPYRAEIYSSIRNHTKEEFMLLSMRKVPAGEVYQQNLNSWIESSSNRFLPATPAETTETAKKVDKNADYFTKDTKLNLERMVSDESYFYRKINRINELSRPSGDCDCPYDYTSLFKTICTFSRDELSRNIELLNRILEKLHTHPALFGYSRDAASRLYRIFYNFLYYHQLILYYVDNKPEETKVLLQDVYNTFFGPEHFGALWCIPSLVRPQDPAENRLDFDKLNECDSYFLLTLKYLTRFDFWYREKLTKHCIQCDFSKISSLRPPEYCDPKTFFRHPEPYNPKTFTYRINVLNNLIRKIDTFKEFTPRNKDYLKKFFSLFLLHHQAEMHLNEGRPEDAMQCLNELKEKSKEVFPYYESHYVYDLRKTCKAKLLEQQSQNRMEDKQVSESDPQNAESHKEQSQDRTEDEQASESDSQNAESHGEQPDEDEMS